MGPEASPVIPVAASITAVVCLQAAPWGRGTEEVGGGGGWMERRFSG